ncbi:MAG: Hsp70 family protein [Pirellulaceae bacterium]
MSNSDPDPKIARSRDLDDATRFTSPEDAARVDPADHEFELVDSDAELGPAAIGVVGEYLLQEKIGEGGMGSVYRAEHRTMNRLVALKILSRSIAGQSHLRDQFFSEIRAVARLMHPNIVTAFDAGSVGDIDFLVMELVEGEVLSARIRRAGPLSNGEAVHVLEQAAQALSYAHSVGIVHRDIKPANMMLTENGTLKILDFGLARFGQPKAAAHQKNMFMGTPEYMSPEQIENSDSVDGRSDLYSLGASLYYFLTGKTMFVGERAQVAVAQIRHKPPALFLVRGDVDLRLDAVFQRLVQKSPASRYGSADELLGHLRELGLAASPVTGKAQHVLARGSLRLTDHPTSVARTESTMAKQSQIVAIDLGMLASTAAYYDPELGPQLIDQGEGNKHSLRNMLWSSSDQIKIGSAATAMRQQNPQQVIHAIQRQIGAREITQTLCGRRVPPEVALAAILRQIVNHAAPATDGAHSAIVTVPGSYDQVHRRSIRDACRIAGIQLVQLLDKPLAAALCWLDLNQRLRQAQSDNRAIEAKLLFVHLGGTGLEASLLHASGTSVKQLGLHGNWKLGSLRWQNALTEFFVGELRAKTGKSIREDVSAATRLQRSVELAMDRLTRTPKVEVRFEWRGVTINQVVTQQGLVKIAPAMVESLQQAIQGACQNARVDIAEVDHILMAGALLRIKPIQAIVTACVPHAAEVSVLEKSEIARGAAIMAHYLTSATPAGADLHLHATSTTNYDLGLLAAASPNEPLKPRVLIQKGTELPVQVARTLRPNANAGPNDKVFSSLQLIESTSLGSSNWHLLAKASPDATFPQHRRDETLQLQFGVDESGILQASLQWPAGNRQSLIPLCAESALSDDEISQWHDWLSTAMLCSTEE